MWSTYGTANYSTPMNANAKFALNGTAFIVGSGRAQTSLSVDNGTPTYGNLVTLTATVNASFGPAPTGTVNFYDGGTRIGSTTVSAGQASLQISTLSRRRPLDHGHLRGRQHQANVLHGQCHDGHRPHAHDHNPRRGSGRVSLRRHVQLHRHDQGQQRRRHACRFRHLRGLSDPSHVVVLGSGTLVGGSATLAVSGLSVGTHTVVAAYAGSGVDLIHVGGSGQPHRQLPRR